MKARNNPFSAKRIHSLSYRSANIGLADLLSKLEQLNYLATIIGPEGSGKTTLLEELKKNLVKDGFTVHSIFVNDTKPFTKDDQAGLIANLKPDNMVFLDGADLLSKLGWKRFKSNVLKSAKGLLITSHKPGLLPTLIECSTSFELFTELVTHLSIENHQLSQDLLAQIYKEHRGNIRDCFRHLYDVYAAMHTKR